MSGKRIDRKEVYKGKIFTVVEDTIRFDNGEEAKWDLVLHNGACAIVPLTSDGKVILVSQYRNAEDGKVLEIPAGKLEKGEDPLNCAYRELEEETGMKAAQLQKICEMYTAVGFSDEKLHLYLAADLEQGVQDLDEDEYVDILTYPIAEAIQMIYTGVIKDSKTIVGLLALEGFLKQSM